MYNGYRATDKAVLNIYEKNKFFYFRMKKQAIKWILIH
jgi:hypothetical protein